MLIAGDIGGTKTDIAVFSTEAGPRAPVIQQRFATNDYPSLEALVRDCLQQAKLPVTDACFAVAGPVVDGSSQLTNVPWVIKESELREALDLRHVRLLNDVEAMAEAVPYVREDERTVIRQGQPVATGAIAFIAPGTGLGEAFLTWSGSHFDAHPSEGSHVDFGPTTPQETELLRFLQARWGRVSYERACAGQSIPDLYEFLKLEGNIAESAELQDLLSAAGDRTPVILTRAFDSSPDPLCRATMNMFVSILGAAAGNLALTVMATGGIYIAGGIATRMAAVSQRDGSVLISALERKGRLSPVLQRIPVYLVTAQIALLGAAVHAMNHSVAAFEVAA